MNIEVLNSEAGQMLHGIFSAGYCVCFACFTLSSTAAISGFIWILKKTREADREYFLKKKQ